MCGQHRFDVIQQVWLLLPSLIANVLDFTMNAFGDMHRFQSRLEIVENACRCHSSHVNEAIGIDHVGDHARTSSIRIIILEPNGRLESHRQEEQW